MSFNTKKIVNLFASSGIIRFSKKCYDAMLSGFFGSMLTNYSSRERLFESSAIGGRSEDVGSWKDSRISRFRRRAIVSYENSRILGALSHMGDWLLGCQMKLYGFFFMYFGLCTVLMNLVKRFGFSVDMSAGAAWMIGALLIAVAFPMLLSGKNLASALSESFVFSTAVFDLLGFSHLSLKKYSSPHYGAKRYLWGAVFGAFLGCLSYFISPLLIVLGLVGLVGAVMVYKRPEVGVLFTVLVAPFLTFIGSPSIILAVLIIYTFVCMCVKAFLGKLILAPQISDAFVAIFMLIMLMGGVISMGGAASMREAAIYVCFMFIYFMIVSLITTRDRLERFTAMLVASGTLTALYGLYQKLSGNMEVGTMDKEMFGDLGGRITSTFENSNMLGVFLIMVFPFALSYVFRSKRLFVRLTALASCGIMGLCLIYTWSRGAWLGLIIACFVFVLLYSHYIIPVLLPVGALGVTLLWDKLGGSGFINSLIGRFSSIITMSDSSSVYRLGIWRGSLKVAQENWMTGIGVGTEAFRSVYIRFAESGIETAVHSHNLFLQIFIETGAIGLLIFLAALLLCVKSGLEMIRRSSHETMAEKAMCVAGISGLCAALLQGMTDFIWYNYRIFFFFWVVVGILSAAARIGIKKNRSHIEY